MFHDCFLLQPLGVINRSYHHTIQESLDIIFLNDNLEEIRLSTLYILLTLKNDKGIHSRTHTFLELNIMIVNTVHKYMYCTQRFNHC